MTGFSADLLRQCWFLTGPTACGKTDLSLELAERLNAEIVALDSMTVYRGMDIGTAKPSANDRSRVPHHLIDIRDPHEEFSLADYLGLAKTCCEEIVARSRVPLFVGGTGLYLRGILRGVFSGPAADWGLRRAWEERVAREGPEPLHKELAGVDPLTAKRLHPNDVRRVMRALEVFHLTGTPLSAQQDQGPRPVEQRPEHVYWLSPPRDWLYERIDARVTQMVQQGLLQEVVSLARRHPPLSHTARQALGYKEVIDWLESNDSVMDHNGGSSFPNGLPEPIVSEIQTRTRQFAKRQHTWFRNLAEVKAISLEEHVLSADQFLRLAGL